MQTYLKVHSENEISVTILSTKTFNPLLLPSVRVVGLKYSFPYTNASRMFQRPKQCFELTDILWLNYRFLEGEIPQTCSFSKGQFRRELDSGLGETYFEIYQAIHRGSQKKYIWEYLVPLMY